MPPCSTSLLYVAFALLIRPISSDLLRDCFPELGSQSGETSSRAAVFRSSQRYEDPRTVNAPKIAKSSHAVRCPLNALLGRPACPRLNFSTSAKGHMFFDKRTGHYSYEPDACKLRRLKSEDAKTCLSSLGPLLFIGDSVTRYQFLTLVHFLAAGKYQHPFDGKDSLSNAHTHDGRTNDEQYHKLWENAREQVEEHDPGGFLYYNMNREIQKEHAHAQLTSAQSASEGLGEGLVDVYYHYLSYVTPEHVKHAVHWALEKRKDFSYVIINACAHYSWDAKHPRLATDAIASLRWANKHLPQPTQVVWKTCATPYKRRRTVDRSEAEIRAHCDARGIPVFDVRAVSLAAVDQHIYATWDPGTVHFLQFMYEQFNDLLLNILC